MVNYSTIQKEVHGGDTLNHYYSYVLPFCPSHNSDSYHRPKATWKEASDLCKAVGGYLPIVRSRKELDKITSLFKLKRLTLPLIQIMFLGLRTTNTSKVRFEIYFTYPEIRFLKVTSDTLIDLPVEFYRSLWYVSGDTLFNTYLEVVR